MTFNPHDPATWPVWLYSHHMVQIYTHYADQVSFEQSVRRGKFDLPPAKRRPLRWRRAAVQADVEGPVTATVRIRKVG